MSTSINDTFSRFNEDLSIVHAKQPGNVKTYIVITKN